jgi:uncharacterized membrane protein
MNSEISKRSNDLFAVIIALLLVFDAAVILDIPIFRQAISLFYLTAIPGFLLVKALRLDALGKVETVLFSVGFSISLSMFLGLSGNIFAPFLGEPRPLSMAPLLIITNAATLVLAVAAYLNGEAAKRTSHNARFSFVSIMLLAIPVVLAVLGAALLNLSGSSLLLEVVIFVVAVLFGIVVLYSKLFPPQFYSIAVFVIAISLLFHSSLVSTHIVSFGSDVNLEYLAFKTVDNNAYWSLRAPSLTPFLGLARINAMLSVTILPVVYSTLSNIDSTFLFKIFFPFILSLVAIGLYQVWQAYVGKKYALISAFLLTAQATFYTEMLGLSRQIVAEFFFVLLLIVIFNKRIKPFGKMLCFMVFGVSLVVSHYAIAEIFLFFLVFPFIVSLWTKRLSRKIGVAMVVFFSVFMFLWYIFTTSGSVFASFEQYGNYVLSQAGDFFSPSSRGSDVALGLGFGSVTSFWNILSRFFAYLTEGLIVIAFIGLVLKRTVARFDSDYLAFCFAAMAFLVAIVVVPGLAKTFNMTRFYHILLFFLAPLCALGADMLVALFSKKNQVFAALRADVLTSLFGRHKKVFVSILLLAILLPYFFFQTGFVYELTGAPSWSISLSKNRMSPFQLYVGLGYVTDQDVAGAKWMQKGVNYSMGIWADDSSVRNILEREALLIPGYLQILSNTTVLAPGEVLYLSTLNMVAGNVSGLYSNWETSDLYSNFDNAAVVYSNGANQVLKDTR